MTILFVIVSIYGLIMSYNVLYIVMYEGIPLIPGKTALNCYFEAPRMLQQSFGEAPQEFLTWSFVYVFWRMQVHAD